MHYVKRAISHSVKGVKFDPAMFVRCWPTADTSPVRPPHLGERTMSAPRPDTPEVSASVLTQALAQFNTTFGAYTADHAGLDLPIGVLHLRMRLLREEFAELMEALDGTDVAHIAKEAADLAYVLQGTCDALGIDLDRAIAEVHVSNMSKVGADGRVTRDAGGKILKGPGYFEPDMTPALRGH